MKFKLFRDTEYVMGHLRYGHLEGIVQVDTEEELKKMIADESINDYMELVIDDYSVDDVDYGDYPVEYEVIE